MRPLKTGHLLIVSTVAFFASLACLALLIANVSKVQLGEGGGSIGPSASQLVPIAVYVLIGIWVAVFAIILVRMIMRGRMPRAVAPPSRSILTWVVILIILTSILVIIQLTNLQLNPSGQNSQEQQGQQTQNATMTNQNTWSASAPLTVVVAILVAVIALSIGLTLRSSRNGSFQRKNAPPPENLEGSEAVIDAAIEDLRTSDDPRGAIIRIYAQMCRLMRKEPEEWRTLTPRELKALAVAGYGWPEAPVARLTSIFEEARYSDHQIQEKSKATALACLDQIKDSLPEQRGGEAAA